MDEIDRVGADVLPQVRREHEGGVLDLLADLFPVIEREGARESDLKV